jgi:site-specific recombinase XerD
MATIKFRLNKPTEKGGSLKERKGLKDKKVSVRACIYISDDVRPEITTFLSIEPKHWNDEIKRAKKGLSGHMLFNQRLKIIETDLENLWLQNIYATREELKKLMQQYFRRKDWSLKPGEQKAEQEKKNESDPSLIAYIKNFIKECEQGLIVREGTTITTYKGLLNLLLAFAKEKKMRLDFEAITLKFYKHFVAFLYDRGNCDNTVGKQIKILKMFMMAAFEEENEDGKPDGLHNSLSFKKKKFKKLEADSDDVSLSETEINSIYKLDLSSEPKMERYRDLFVFNCWVGIRYGDLCTIRSEQITHRIEGTKLRPYLRLTPYKTQNEVIIPFHELAEEIYEKYNNQLPKLKESENMTYNKAIRKIVARAGINSIQQNRTFIKEKAETKWVKKFEMVSAHTARRSFATNCYKMGIKSLTIMAITGHKSEKVFLKYIRITKEEHAEIMAKAFSEALPQMKVG